MKPNNMEGTSLCQKVRQDIKTIGHIENVKFLFTLINLAKPGYCNAVFVCVCVRACVCVFGSPLSHYNFIKCGVIANFIWR